MGFDIHGRAARSAKGEYFRNNVWWWRPLADYVLSHITFPENDSTQWHSNSGYVVSSQSAEIIATDLVALLRGGETGRYATQRERELRDLPDERCDLCAGTGQRSAGPCNGCHGKGVQRPFVTMYPFSVENVAEFAAFCRESGGFEIW